MALIGFEAPETKFKLDDNGKPIGVYVKEKKTLIC